MDDDLNYYSNDFLSNGGLYQLFNSEFMDDRLLWGSNNRYGAFDEDDQVYTNPNEANQNYNNDTAAEFPTIESNDSNSVGEDGLCSLDVWQSSDDIKTFDNDWELNIENLLFENYVGCSDWQQTIILPDKTLFCNDSCNLFLKESSENLQLTNLQTFSPTEQSSFYHHPTTVLNAQSTVQQTNIAPDVHDLDKIFICTYEDCKKVYAKPAHLKAHLRRHAGDKPYVCNWPNCTWKFSRSDELARHRRSHSGVKPYKCNYCTKCFSRSDHLTKHRKVHERKMAKLKGIWPTVMPHRPGRPGRRPKTNELKFQY